MAPDPKLRSKYVWLRRAAYMAMAIAMFVGIPLILVMLADLTGVIHFREIFGPLIWWNELSAPSFMLGFLAIVLMVGIVIFFILKAFDTSEGAW